MAHADMLCFEPLNPISQFDFATTNATFVQDGAPNKFVICDRAPGGGAPREATFSFPGVVLQSGLLPFATSSQ